MSDDDRDGLLENARRQFDASVERLDAATLSRLNRSRHAAIAAASSGHARRYWGLTLGGASAAALLVAILLRAPGADLIDAPDTDLDLLLGEDSIEMLEDLEFYRWLDAAERAAPAAGQEHDG